jgi:hypothetical protein
MEHERKNNMNGQLELFEQAKAPIYRFGLSAVWNECPNCRTQPSKIGDTKFIRGGGHYIDQPERCPYCGQLLDWSDEAIEAAAKYSKDYPRN